MSKYKVGDYIRFTYISYAEGDTYTIERVTGYLPHKRSYTTVIVEVNKHPTIKVNDNDRFNEESHLVTLEEGYEVKKDIRSGLTHERTKDYY